MERPPLPPKHLHITPESSVEEGQEETEPKSAQGINKKKNSVAKQLFQKMFPSPDVFAKNEKESKTLDKKAGQTKKPVFSNKKPLIEAETNSKATFRDIAIDEAQAAKKAEDEKFEQSMIRLDQNVHIQKALKKQEKATLFERYSELQDKRQQHIRISLLIACILGLLVGGFLGLDYLNTLVEANRVYEFQNLLGHDTAQAAAIVCAIISPLLAFVLLVWSTYSLLVLIRERYVPALFVFVASAGALFVGMTQLAEQKYIVCSLVLLGGFLLVGGTRKIWKL